jgi:DNA-binding PadR family transcriptional regulator
LEDVNGCWVQWLSGAMARELTTTSYAILGLLGVRPWTTYELAQQMQRALGRFWPRAESQFYEEPKRLVARGLAKATPEQVGKRPRTRYSITAKGRRALAAWVATPPTDGPVVEMEPLVKLFFAEHGSRDDALAHIDSVRQWSAGLRAIDREQDISKEYLEGRGPFPERLPWLIVVAEFIERFEAMVEQWTEWATEIVSEWPDDVSQAEPAWDALQAMADRVARSARATPRG